MDPVGVKPSARLHSILARIVRLVLAVSLAGTFYCGATRMAGYQPTTIVAKWEFSNIERVAWLIL